MRPRKRSGILSPTQDARTGTGLLRRHRPDYSLLILTAILLAVGLITLYSISPGLAATTGTSGSYYVIRQMIAIGLGLIAFAVAVFLPVETWQRYLKPILIVTLISAFAVRLVGQKVNGAYRWIQIGGFSFQAVELIKFTILIWLATFLAEKIRLGQIRDFSYTLKPILIALLMVGIVVAGLQSDLGSTGVIVIIMAAMGFVAGLPLKRVAIIGGIVVIGLVVAISSSSYRRARLFTFLHPTQNCQTSGSGYQACQAVIAVGSGGVLGKGLAKSVQDYGYLPESDNDSIFAIYAEQFGFVGVVVLIALFIALFIRIRNVIERAPDNYTRLICVGVLAWIATQTFMNIGAMIGLLPLKGITLPMISYGGTSIMFVMAVMGLVFNISHYTSNKLIDEEERSVGGNNEDSTMRRRYGRPYYANSVRRP